MSPDRLSARHALSRSLWVKGVSVESLGVVQGSLQRAGDSGSMEEIREMYLSLRVNKDKTSEYYYN